MTGLKALLSSRAGRLLAASTGALLIATIAALVLLRPSDRHHGSGEAFGGRTVSATIVRAQLFPCRPDNQNCRRVVARVTEGHDEGRRVSLDLGPTAATPDLSPGEAIRVARNKPAAELPDAPPYACARRDPLSIASSCAASPLCRATACRST